MKDTNEKKDGTIEKTSKGIAFIVFKEHETALKALRAVNNNPTIFGENHRPIVEFAIENAKKAQEYNKHREETERNRAEWEAKMEAQKEARKLRKKEKKGKQFLSNF